MNTRSSSKKSTLRVEMPCQPPLVRRTNFDEVALGYTREMALQEASRCLRCKKPLCISGCPVQVPIRDFIAELAQGYLEASYRIIKSTNNLPAVCGRVCQQEHQCEGKCVLGVKGQPVAIGRLERFVADSFFGAALKFARRKSAKNSDKRVAMLGAGPASLTCAGICAAGGLAVDVFEGLHEPGGVLMYGIPSFRLPKNVVAAEIDDLCALGVNFHLNRVGGRTVTVEELREEYDAIFIGVGAGLPIFLGIPGENLVGVFSANEYLTRVNLMDAASEDSDTPVLRGHRVAVVGGGNTAMDSVRTARRLGAELAMIVYRRSEEEMPARIEEVKHAKEEGIEFRTLHNPIEYLGDENGRIRQMKLQKMALGDADASGRRRPVAIEGAIETIDVDQVIVSIGVSPNPLIPSAFSGLEVSSRGTIIVNEEDMRSSLPDVYAGGDIVRGGATVILAMGDGRKAAHAMHRAIKN